MGANNKIHQLDLNLLKVFKALYAEQNMTRAAEVLHLTPSAVSHAIKRLRHTLDDELFVRSQNKMRPTPACQRMAPTIINNLTQLQQVLQQWGEFSASESTYHFKIGMHDAFEPTVLTQLAVLIDKHAPNASFSSIKFDRTNLERELASSKIDLAIDVAMTVRQPVKRHTFKSSEFFVLMRHNHPSSKHLEQEAYLAARHISVSNRPNGMTTEDAFFNNLGLKRESKIRCQNYYAAREIVRNSDHLLTLPKMLAMQLLDSELILQPLPFELKPFTVSLYWHEHADNDDALSWLRDLIKDNIVLG